MFEMHQLPQRPGERPETSDTIPHIQLDQWPSASMIERVREESLRLPYVESRESRFASIVSKALTLPQEVANGPASAFIDDHEFCHLHAPPDGTIHLTLPLATMREALAFKWAEQHILAAGGYLSENVVLVYAPRTENELAVVLFLVKASYEFALGMQARV